MADRNSYFWKVVKKNEWFWGACLMALAVNFPSVHTARVLSVPLEIENFPKTVKGGELLLIPRMSPNMFLNNKILTEVPGQELLLGVVSVYSPSVSKIHSIPNQHENWREGIKRLFRGPIIPWQQLDFKVNKKELRTHAKDLRLPSSVVSKLESADKKLRRTQWRKVKAVVNASTGDLTTECFGIPVDSKRISPYGSARRLPNGRTYYHTGLDLRAWYGTPITSTASGTVVLAEHMVAPGNNLILDHGAGLYSRYMHFSKFGKYKVGDRVPAGAVVGYSGSTGRSQGPHLHFEIIWKGNHASPEKFLRTWEQTCDPA